MSTHSPDEQALSPAVEFEGSTPSSMPSWPAEPNDESRLHAAQISELFSPFACTHATELYTARDREAVRASQALAQSRFDDLRGLQAVLRAGFGIALANNLGTAAFIDNARLWRAKVRAAAKLHGDLSDSVVLRRSTVDAVTLPSFDLMNYPSLEFEASLIAALSLSSYRKRIGSIVPLVFKAIDSIPALHAWREAVDTNWLAERAYETITPMTAKSVCVDGF